MTTPLYVVDIFETIVTAVESEVLTTLQANETSVLGSTKIETINYQKGHSKELIQTLLEMDRDPASNKLRYPLVWLVQDFTERRGRKGNFYADVNLSIVIAHYTSSTHKVDDRYTKVFKPILYPIYYELMNQIRLHPLIEQSNPDLIYHDKTDRLFWGSQANENKNKLTDFVDAIEISNLQLNIYFKNC